MSKPLLIPRRPQTKNEEVANAISHGLGFIAALVAAPFMIKHSLAIGQTGFIVGSIVFAATTALLYLASALYHALPPGRLKRIFRIIEHSAIFLLIAGTYTPFTLGALRGPWGWTLLGLIWCLACAGVALKTFQKMSHPIISTCLYLLMGWLIVLAAGPLIDHVPQSGLIWLFSGGAAYTAGVAFFAFGSLLHYGHFIWHIFVLAGTACHYFAVLWYAA
jgi:hemolysin III